MAIEGMPDALSAALAVAGIAAGAVWRLTTGFRAVVDHAVIRLHDRIDRLGERMVAKDVCEAKTEALAAADAEQDRVIQDIAGRMECPAVKRGR